MKKSVLKVFCAVTAAGLILAGCSGKQAEDGETVAVQSVAMLAGLNTGLQNRYAGKVVAQQSQDVKKDETRTVKELYVQEGDEVKVGDILFSYDVEEMQLNIQQGELEIQQMQNSIETTRSQIKALEKEKNSASSSEKLEYTLQIQSLEADISQTEYNIGTKNLELERLKKSLDNSDVKAEIDGIVQSISENGYDNYGNEQAYITILQVGNYRIQGTINELNAGSLPVGSPVIIRSRVDESQTWSGYLDSVDFESTVNDNNNYYGPSDEMTNSTKYPFYVMLDSSEGLMMGQHVYIELDNGQEEQREGIWLASYFMEIDGDKAYVWAANDKDKLEKREITLGLHDDAMDEYQVLEGLSADDYIAIPEEGLANGAPVTRYDDAFFGGDMSEDGMYANGDSAEGEYLDEGFAEGEYVEGGSAEGEFIDEGLAEGEFPEGEAAGSELTEGEASESELTEGEPAEEPPVEGEAAEGDLKEDTEAAE